MKNSVINHNSFILRALPGDNAFWKYVVGVILIFFFYGIIGSLPYTILAISELGMGAGTEHIEEFISGKNKNLMFILLVIPSILGFFSVPLVVKFLHGRHYLSVFTAAKRFRWGRFAWGAAVFGFFAIFTELVLYFLYPENYIFHFEGSSFWVLLIIATVMIPFQAGFEEIFLRGYLLQGLGLWLKNGLATIFITSVIFGFMHILNPEVAEFGVGALMPYYISFGFFLGLIAVMDGGLEIPIGIHAVNNWYLSTLVTFKASALQTYALFEIKEMKLAIMFVLFGLGCILFFVLAAKRYGWHNWKGRLMGRLNSNLEG